MIRLVIDLELESDGAKTGKVIQLGYSIVSTKRGEILYTGGDYVNPGRPLHPFIINLTGIKDRDIETRGVSLHVAYLNMVAKFKEISLQNPDEKPFSQIVEWGSGDVVTLKEGLFNLAHERYLGQELESHQEIVELTNIAMFESGKHIRNNYEWVFGRASLNLKAVFQMYQDANEGKARSGLKKSMETLGVPWEIYMDEVSPGKFRQRSAHDARADALNTAKLFLYLSEKMKQTSGEK